MKKILLLFAFVSCMLAYAGGPNQIQLFFSVGIVDPSGTANHLPRSPTEMPQATIDGKMVTFTAGHATFLLVLVDSNDDVAYYTIVPSSVNVVVFPPTLTETYELQLYDGSEYYYYTEIVL